MLTVGDGNSIEAGTLLELIPRKPGSTAVTIASTNVKNIMGEDVTVSEASVAQSMCPMQMEMFRS